MGERRFENPQSVNLQSVLSASAAIHHLLAEREREQGRDVSENMCLDISLCTRRVFLRPSVSDC